MKATAFDGMARDLGDVSTRRSVFRLLGGAAALGAGLAVGTHADSLAKGKSQPQRKGKSRGAQDV